MKKTLFWYIASETLLYFFICFLFFFFIFFVNQILLMAEDILSKKAPALEVILLIFYATPAIIATSAPFAALVGTLMCMGRLVSDREVLSLNALGVSTTVIIIPVLAVGIFISGMSFFTNDILLPAGNIQFNKIYRKILTSTPALELESGAIKRNQNALVISGNITDSEMDSLLVLDTDPSGNRRVIAAPGATIQAGDNSAVVMSLNMHNPFVAVMDKNRPSYFDILSASEMSYNILVKNVMPSYSGNVTPKEMTSRDLLNRISEMREESKDERTMNMYLMEYHKKFSIPFGAFFFVLLSFPLGLSTRSNGQSVGFILGLLIAVFYWSMLIGGQTLGLRLGYNGPLMVWLPNIVIFIFALVSYLRRALR